MSPAFKRYSGWVGSILAFGGVVFVILQLYEYGEGIDLGQFGYLEWLLFLVLAILYAIVNLFLVLAWRLLLSHFGIEVTKTWALKTFGVSQIIKYMPGNVLHLAGRQAMGLAKGLPGIPLAKSIAWELGLISIAGGLYGLLALPLKIPSVTTGASIAVFIILIGLALAVVSRLLSVSAARAFGYYLLFLALAGTLFTGVWELINPAGLTEEISSLSLLGAYTLSWFVGLVTPGAPAGLGVRELVLMYLFKGSISSSDLLLAVLLGRAITVFGDLVLFLYSLTLTTPGNGVQKG